MSTTFKRKLVGSVISKSSAKTIVVSVVRKTMHNKYSKFVKTTKKFHAHDENETARLGEVVTIMESKPFSKLKKWELVTSK